MALYIFSDAHLGSGPPESDLVRIARIKQLFKLVEHDGERLIILGDLFDFWFEYKHTIPKAFHEVLFLLSHLKHLGVQIDYISGNHDFWMGDFFERHLEIPIHRDSLDLTYHEKKLHLIHGDGLAAADGGYRFLKKILRNPVNIWLYRKLPPDWAYSLARWVSGSSRRYTARRDHKFAADYAAYAKQKLAEGYDIVVIGHLHIPVFEKYGNGVYINSGDFINHFTYVRFDGTTPTLEHLEAAQSA